MLRLQQLLLLLQQVQTGLDGSIPLLIQANIFDECLHGHTGGAHTDRVFHPTQISLLIITHTAGCAVHCGDQTDALIIAQGILRNVILLADFPNRHRSHQPFVLYYTR